MKTQLPIVRLEMLVRTEGPLQLPPYAGSMLRGAFGHALMALSPLPHSNEQPCTLRDTCAYCQVFATPALPEHSLQKFSQMPHPYVIEPPQGGPIRLHAGDVFVFSLVLVGKALEHLPTIIRAFERALRVGLGMEERQRTRCTLLGVRQEHCRSLLWQAGSNSPPLAPEIMLQPPMALGSEVTLHVTSPMRLQLHGQPVHVHALTARTLLISLARRYQLMLDVHCGSQAPQLNFAELSAQAEAIRLTAKDMQWFDWKRFSQRQQRAMKLGGLLGTIHLQGELAPFSQLLHVGQWLHIGKGATFGLGRYLLKMPQLPKNRTNASTLTEVT